MEVMASEGIFVTFSEDLSQLSSATIAIVFGLLACSLVALFCLSVLLWRNYRRQSQKPDAARSEYLLERLIDTIPDHVYAKDESGRYILCNQAFAQFAGCDKERLIGRKVDEVFNTSVQAFSDAQESLLLSGAQRAVKEGWIAAPDGSMAYVQATKLAMSATPGAPSGVWAVARDITQKKSEELLLQQNSRTLKSLVSGLALEEIYLQLSEGLENSFAQIKVIIVLSEEDQSRCVAASGLVRHEVDLWLQQLDSQQLVQAWRGNGHHLAPFDQGLWQPLADSLEKIATQAICAVPVLDNEGSAVGMVCFFHPNSAAANSDFHQALLGQTAQLVSLVLERSQADSQLQKLSLAVEQSPSMVMITSAKGRIEYINERFTKVTGYCPEELLGQTPLEWDQGEQQQEQFKRIWRSALTGREWHGEMLLNTKQGDQFWAVLSVSPIIDSQGTTTHFISVSEDISEQKKAQEKIEQLAFYDSLTGLGNRRLFREQLEHELRKMHRSGNRLAIFYLDLDNFKQVNDSLGHDTGDVLLKTIGERFKKSLRASDVIARLGGDEFIALLPDVDGVAEAEIVADKLIASLTQPLRINDQPLMPTVSMGITIAPVDGENWPVLMKNADLAMYRAKHRGRNNYQFFTQQMNDELQYRVEMEKQLRLALSQEQFHLDYQPQWRLLGELQFVCMEALVRWNHPERGLVSPADFIPIAEELGLIVPLGDWVLDRACRDGAELYRMGQPTRVAVNLSMRQLLDTELVGKVERALQRYNLPAQRLELEITESLVMEDVNTTLSILHRLKALGVYLSIDDFGTGYSSLSYLKKLPVDHLKVDASFVRDIPQDKHDMEITAAVIAMAHKLSLEVVAEGVETTEQLDFLRENGCEMGQGYLLARPIPIASILQLLDRECEIEIAATS